MALHRLLAHSGSHLTTLGQPASAQPGSKSATTGSTNGIPMAGGLTAPAKAIPVPQGQYTGNAQKS